MDHNIIPIDDLQQRCSQAFYESEKLILQAQNEGEGDDERPSILINMINQRGSTSNYRSDIGPIGKVDESDVMLSKSLIGDL